MLETATQSAAPAAQQAATVDADIAAFMAENPDTGSVVPGDEPQGEEQTPATQQTEETEQQGEQTPPAIDSKHNVQAILAALDAKDPAALLEALGDSAEEVLGSKAHVTLRIQARDAKVAQREALRLQTEAAATAKRLEEDYGDPIAAREAAVKGTAESAEQFVRLVEKWAKTDWNTLLGWVSKSLIGKPHPLPQTRQAPAVDPARQAQAMQQTREWVSTTLQRSHGALLTAHPETVDLVIAEIRAGVRSGIDTPQKAMPKVLEKLKKTHDALSRHFGAVPAPATKKPPSPIARVNATDASQPTAEMSLDDLISEISTAARGAR